VGHLPGPLLTNATSPSLRTSQETSGIALAAGLKSAIHTEKQSKALPCSCSLYSHTLALQLQQESGRGTKNQVCMLRTKLAGSRAASPRTVTLLKTCSQFQEHAVFSCCGLAHNVCVQKETARHRQSSNPDVFCVNKERRKKVCALLFPPYTRWVSKPLERPPR